MSCHCHSVLVLLLELGPGPHHMTVLGVGVPKYHSLEEEWTYVPGRHGHVNPRILFRLRG